MGPYQHTPKEVARAMSYSGLGVRSVGPVGDFLEWNSFIWCAQPTMTPVTSEHAPTPLLLNDWKSLQTGPCYPAGLATQGIYGQFNYTRVEKTWWHYLSVKKWFNKKGSSWNRHLP